MPTDADDEYPLSLNWGQRLRQIGSNSEYLDILAKKAGLSFNFDAVGSNSLDSHRLLLHAEHVDQEEDREGGSGCNRRHYALSLRLNLAQKYFTEGKRLADHEVLLGAVEEIGMNVARARTILNSEEYRDVCLQSASDLKTMGINQIPVFFFQSGEFEATVHGSSGVPDFLEVFKQAEAFWMKADRLRTFA